ncbi:MAG: PHP domain-containing protein [Acutalibacteraceae bacterium]
MTADLHCHTKLSDGTMGIEDLIVLAMKNSIKTISVTDHDCLAGNVRAQIVAKRYDINVIPGVELTCTDRKRSAKAHILCYYADKPERLESLCYRNSTARRKAGQIMIVRAAERFPIAPEFIVKCASGSTNIYKQHIMQALLECGYTTTIFGELYQKLFTKESEENILVNTVYATPEETIETIHDAGGIAVLAHPGFFDNFELLDELIELGLDGVEVWHPMNTPEQQEYLKEVAKKNKLLMTGGSDFHGGYNMSNITLGDYGPPQDCVESLINYKAKLRRKQKKLEKEATLAAQAAGQ